MAVLVEGISVIVRRDSITDKYIGGWKAFQNETPSAPFYFDDEIACVGFMTPSDVKAYIDYLTAQGLIFLENGTALDIAVVDQLKGITLPCDWLEFTRINYKDQGEISICWLFEGPRLYGGIHFKSDKFNIVLPPGWEYETSFSKSQIFITGEQMEERLEYVRTEGNFDFYKDKESGQELFVDHSFQNNEDFLLIAKKLEAISREAIRLEAERDRAAAVKDENAFAMVYSRLAYHLLPQAQQLLEKSGEEIPFPYFVVGLIHNIMAEYEEAEEALMKAYKLQSDSYNILLELTRCSMELNKTAQALFFAKQAVEVKPLDAAAWGNLAMSLILCGHKSEAHDAIERAVKLDPNDEKNLYIMNNFERYFTNI